MKKSLVLILAILFAIGSSGYAQIEEEILLSKSTRIEKGRAFVLEKFLDRDYAKVKEAKDYLLSLEDDNYSAFYPTELCYLLLWTNEFDALTAFMRQMDSTFNDNWRKKVLPHDDRMFEQIYRRSVEDEHLLRFNLEEAVIPDEDKDFLTLFLDWNLKMFSYQNLLECDEKANQFLEKYPNSDYEWFVKNRISTRAKRPHRGNWAIGMGLDLCSGFVTGKLSETMTPIFGIGLSINLAYKKLLMELGYDVVASKTKVDQTISTGVINAGHHNSLLNFYLDASYPIISGKRWSVSPLVGIGGCIETYGSNNLSYDEIDELEKSYLVARTGLMLDIKTHGMFEGGVLRIKYHCGLSNHGGDISSIHLISIGGAGFFN